MGFRRDPEGLKGRKIERDLLRRVLRLARPYRRLLIGFLLAVIASAVVTAIPALLLKTLLDTAIPDKDVTLVTLLAGVAVVLAIAGAALSLLQRWYSARVGEGLIYDLRVALFDHVQRLPISFFTRTQTGALQSRLNNDVIGAQQAVTTTLGTVVSNVITVVVTLDVHARARLAPDDPHAARAPGVHHPGQAHRPEAARRHPRGDAARRVDEQHDRRALQRLRRARREALRQPRPRARPLRRPGRPGARHRDHERDVQPGAVRRARSGRGRRDAPSSTTSAASSRSTGAIGVGTSARSSLYVAQIYQPLSQLSSARVDVMTALVSFERVFEVLDFPPLIDRPRRARSTSSSPDGADRLRARVVPPPGARRDLARLARERKPPARTTRAERRGSCATSASRSSPASWSRSSARRAPARRRPRCSCRASTRSPRAGSRSTATTCATSRSSRCATPSAS